MDRVRFGRALGYGARHAAKTLAQMADAASTPSPSTECVQPRARTADETMERPVATRAGARGVAVSQTAVKASQEARRAGRSMLTPVKAYSRAVLLQVAGTFFALVAVGVGRGLWMLRSAVHAAPSSADAQKLYVMAAVFLLFVYFAVSSFVRAGRSSAQR
jgi:hypothetical protein